MTEPNPQENAGKPSAPLLGSDTPRTDNEATWSDGMTKAHVNAQFARGLERELNAANRRIEDLMRRNNLNESIDFGKGR